MEKSLLLREKKNMSNHRRAILSAMALAPVIPVSGWAYSTMPPPPLFSPSNAIININTWGTIGSAQVSAARDAIRRSSGQAAAATARQPTVAPPDTRNRANLRVAHDPAVTLQARHAFIGGLARSSGRAMAAEVDKYFGDIQDAYARVAAPYGLRPDNFGDVMTGFLVVMWMSANRQIALPQRPRVRALRQQMDDAFAAMAVRMPDARQRQLLADSLMYRTCQMVLIREQAVAQSKPELLGTMANATEQFMARQGLSMRALALTNRGLVER
jgi:hypothetical protein